MSKSLYPLGLTCLLVFLLGIGSQCRILPLELQQCRAGDNDCVANTVQQFLILFPQGNSDLDVPRLDNLKLTNITLSKMSQGTPVQLDLLFKEFDILGVETAKIESVSGFEADMVKAKQDINLIIPKITIRGIYSANGKVLLLPINGGGQALIELDQVKVNLQLKVKTEMISGKEHLKLAKMKLTLIPQHISFQLENLLNNNKEVSDSLNKVINENWQDIWQELNGGIHDAVTLIFRNLLANVLKKLPFEEFFTKSK